VRATLPAAFLSIVALAGCSFFQKEKGAEPIPQEEVSMEKEEKVKGEEEEMAQVTVTEEPEKTSPMAEEDGVVLEESDEEASSFAALEQEFPEWIQEWQTHLPDFDLSDMKERKTESIYRDVTGTVTGDMETMPEWPVADCPSVEESKSYDPDGQRYLFNAGCGSPDSEVRLTFPDRRFERILFCGTPCSFDATTWMSDTSFAVVGWSEYYPPDDSLRCSVGNICTVVPMLYIFNLNQDSYTTYEGPEVDRDTFFDARQAR